MEMMRLKNYQEMIIDDSQSQSINYHEVIMLLS